MNNIKFEIIKYIYYLIENFNKNIDSKYIKMDDINSLEEFINKNGDYILETIDYIEEYIKIYNKLCHMNLNGVDISYNGLYDPTYLETLINSFIDNSNNYIINNILYTQRKSLFNSLEKCRLFIKKLVKILEIHSNAINLVEINNNYDYINKIINIFNEEDDSSDGGTPLDALLYDLRTILKSSYNVKKTNVKMKVLKRF